MNLPAEEAVQASAPPRGVRARVWHMLEGAREDDRAGRAIAFFILVLIFLNVLAVILGSVKSIEARYAGLLWHFEVFSVLIFTIEYLLRLWSCTDSAAYRHPVAGRLRFASSPMAVIDLLAVLPFYLPFLGFDLRFIRIFRLLRIVRIAKIGRYYSSLGLIMRVIKNKSEELILAAALMGMLVVISSVFMYHCENAAQPDKFSDIPATLWWAVSTLTTVGYGDLYPITPLGKILGSAIAILGIAMFALPTGILGAGFVEEFQKRKNNHRQCPHCGKEISE